MSKERDKNLVIKHIMNKFDFLEVEVGQNFSPVGNDPDPNDWITLLHSKKYNVYVDLKFFPRITIEPCHTTTYNIGIINYVKGMTPNDVVRYFHNILDN